MKKIPYSLLLIFFSSVFLFSCSKTSTPITPQNTTQKNAKNVTVISKKTISSTDSPIPNEPLGHRDFSDSAPSPSSIDNNSADNSNKRESDEHSQANQDSPQAAKLQDSNYYNFACNEPGQIIINSFNIKTKHSYFYQQTRNFLTVIHNTEYVFQGSPVRESENYLIDLSKIDQDATEIIDEKSFSLVCQSKLNCIDYKSISSGKTDENMVVRAPLVFCASHQMPEAKQSLDAIIVSAKNKQ